MKNASTLFGIFAIILSVFTARSDILFARPLIQEFPVFFVLFIGSVTASFFSFFYLQIGKKWKEFWRFFREYGPFLWSNALLAGILAPTLFLLGITYGSPINASFFVSFTPVFVALLAYFFLKETFNVNFILGGLFMIAGVSYIITKGFVDSINMGWVDLFPLLCSLVYGFNEVLTKKYISLRHLDYFISARVMTTAVFLGLLFLFVLPFESINIESIYSLWPQVFAYSFITILATYFLYYFGLRRLPSHITSSLLLFTPLVGAFYSSYFLGEKIYQFHILGGVFLLIGAVIINLHFRKKTHLTEHVIRQKIHHS